MVDLPKNRDDTPPRNADFGRPCGNHRATSGLVFGNYREQSDEGCTAPHEAGERFLRSGHQSSRIAAAGLEPATAATHATNRPPTTPPGLRGRNSWRGWGRSFLLRARGVAATSGSEETAGRSRLTSNRRFASGRRLGWLRPREVSHWHISANRSNHRPSRRPVARRPTGASSCRPTFDRAIFQGRIDELPVIDIHSL